MSIGKDPVIKTLDQNDMNWINHQLQSLVNYLRGKGLAIETYPTPKELDEHLELGLSDYRDGFLDDNVIIDMYGVGFGHCFTTMADFEWVTFTDEYGTDLAVRSKSTGTVGFPLSSTQKRLNDPTAGRYDAIYITLTKQ